MNKVRRKGNHRKKPAGNLKKKAVSKKENT
jgi:hypothetical protein